MRDNICYLLEQGVATFLFGDHSEFNTLCYEVVSELREVYPKIRRIHYRTDYPDADAYTMQFLLDGYEDSICPDGVAAAGKAAYVERNQAMIQASDFCVFYFNNEYLPASRKESKKDLQEAARLTRYQMLKLARDENITTDVVGSICKALDCTPDDIMEFYD